MLPSTDVFFNPDRPTVSEPQELDLFSRFMETSHDDDSISNKDFSLNAVAAPLPIHQ